MDETTLRALLDGVRDGRVAPDDAVRALRRLPYADLGDARIDHHRQLRKGMPEAVYGPGKSPEQCARIVSELIEHGTGPVLLTRATSDQTKAVLTAQPDGIVQSTTVTWRLPERRREERVVVCSGGTADLPVVQECVATLAAHGYAPLSLVDVGVAGLHRLLAHQDDVLAADAVVVVAGMEGALASVVGGLTGAPVVAVPTSTGYGSSLEGVTALLAMLSSCASGVAVVGIDNGFGAACAVARMLDRSRRSPSDATP